MRTSQGRSEAGFTLISVMVALVMLTIGLLALAKVQTSMVRTQRLTAMRTFALDVARGYTEELRARDPWTLATEGNVMVNVQGQPAAGGPLTRSTTVVDDGTNLVRVTVRIDYPGQLKPVLLETMVYKGAI